jgi:non-ribosomal peptide synthetase component F
MALISLDGQGDVVAEQTVADLARESRRAARALLALGIQKDDPVFVMLPRAPAWYSAVLGAIRIGAVPMPGTNQLTSRDIAYRFRSADAVAAITDAAGVEKIDAIEEHPASLRHRIAWGGGTEGWEGLDALIDAAGDGDTPTSHRTHAAVPSFTRVSASRMCPVVIGPSLKASASLSASSSTILARGLNDTLPGVTSLPEAVLFATSGADPLEGDPTRRRARAATPCSARSSPSRMCSLPM